MPLTSILSVQVRPASIGRYQELVRQLAERARKNEESFRWTAHTTVFGQGPTIHFVSIAESFAALQQRGQTPELLLRVLGEKGAASWLEAIGEATQAQETVIARDRPDLSYVREERRAQDHPFALVTNVRVRPGGREAFEELIRKLAEAIPKVDDPAQLITNQILVGDLARYYTVRPLRELADLDGQRPPDVLLTDAFGAGEGGLIFRGGTEALQEIRREVVMYRPELSNPG
jgi:hypothetical protein